MARLKFLADPNAAVCLTGNERARQVIKAKQETDFIPAKPLTVAQFIAERKAQELQKRENQFLNRIR